MKKSALPLVLAGLCLTGAAQAADWSDTYIGWRYGQQFAEPFEGNGISKNIFNLNHVDGYKYGSNFFNVDMLLSDANDPAGPNSTNGARETYIVYRHTLSASKIFGSSLKYYGVTRDFGLQFGFDWNTKDDVGYNSKKEMIVLGPTVSFDVPGFFDAAILELWESNAPCSDSTSGSSCVPRYHYAPHPALSLAWGIPIGSLPLEFKGYGLWIASKGENEFGYYFGNPSAANQTVAETHFDMEVMLDVGKVTQGYLNGFKIGVEYEYWQNKFGNNASAAGGAGPGAFAHTPMIRGEYHF